MIPFAQATYRTQVKRLRALAEKALDQYPIRVKKIDFINHGENATFKVTATSGEKYLCRIHRNDYHTHEGLLEELNWLEDLAKEGLHVPRPMHTSRGSVIVEIDDPAVGSRHCDVFRWIEGRFLSKSISEDDMFKVGVLLARMQQVGRRMKSRHRRYWTSEGLVGATAKFGSIDRLLGVPPKDQKRITSTRRALLARLKRYEKKNPKKMGLIHADLHFHNLLKTSGGEIAAIDFDDCGFGFHVYDLVIPLLGSYFHLKEHKKTRSYTKLKKALLAGYSSIQPLSEEDLELLQDLIIARRLLMLGWFQSRSDNPLLKGRLLKSTRWVVKYLDRPFL